MANYNPRNWYWIVNGSTTQVFSSARAGYFATNDATYVAWLALDNTPTRIATETDLWDVLIAAGFPQGIPAATAQDQIKDRSVNALDMVAFKVLFNHENRIRTLAGQPTITQAQFKTGLKALL